MGHTVRRFGTVVGMALLAITLVPTACTPQPASSTKNPVILVNGFTGCAGIFDMALGMMQDRLRNDGYQTHIFGYDDCGFGDIRVNASKLGTFVDQVRASSGKAKVDIVGVSMGGLVGRWYVNKLGGVDKVDSLVTVGTGHYGTQAANIIGFFLLGNCAGILACQQAAEGSSFLAELNAGPDALPGVRYTTIISVNDQVVFPYQNAHLRDGSTYESVTIQGQCGLKYVDHGGYGSDGVVYDAIRGALRGGPVRLNCWAL